MDEKDLEQLKEERDEYLNGWKRAKADFINYKKDEGERMSQIAEYVRRELLIRVLPILDNIDRALNESQKSVQSPASPAGRPEGGEDQVMKGFLQIGSQWREFLKQQGVQEITTIGKPFNPELHEAIGEVEPPAARESGMVVEEMEKGYMRNGMVLRPAKVKIIK